MTLYYVMEIEIFNAIWIQQNFIYWKYNSRLEQNTGLNSTLLRFSCQSTGKDWTFVGQINVLSVTEKFYIRKLTQ